MGYLSVNGNELYAEVSGNPDGEAVLLLHGGFCSLESLANLGLTLEPEYAVHAFERAGHGRSADVSGPYSYEQGVADALSYLDAHGISAAHIVGYSDGAIIGLLLARDFPDRVRSLIAISGNLEPSAFEPSELSLQPAPHSSSAAPEQPSPERESYERLSPDGPEHAETVLEKLMELWTTAPNIAPNSLASITARVLVMAGDRDSIRPDHSLRIAAGIPGAELAIVPGASHGLIREKPELVARLVRDFLAA